MALARFLSLAPIALVTLACGGNDVQHIDPQAVAMTKKTQAFYDDGEVKIFEVQAHVQLPIRAPTDVERASLDGAVGPFGHHPWVLKADVGVQVSWTLANLDGDDQSVKITVDPWNEFGKYVPGVSVLGDNTVPNLSGIEYMTVLPGVGSGKSSRVAGTFTYDDMDELATDFATVIDIIKDDSLMPMAMATGGMMDADPRVSLVNHTFNVDNRSGNSPYTDHYTPSTVPALVGFDIGIQTSAAGNIALEFALEVVDRNGDRILPPGDARPKLEARDRVYTVGGAGY
jgi:hypothetical protein